MAAHARCILGADISSNHDILGDNMLYFLKDDAADLQAQLRRCLSSEDLRDRLGSAGRSQVERQYLWSAVAERMERIYQDAKGGGRGG